MSERELWERERGIRKEMEGGGEVERSRAGEKVHQLGISKLFI